MSEVLMPRLSDTMTEGTLLQWLKREGDPIARGDVIAEVETDKAVMEIEAYDSGVLIRIMVEPGSVVPIGRPIAVIGDSAAAATRRPDRVSPAVSDATAQAPRPTVAPPGDRTPISPLARALARKHGLDLTRIAGTGPGGRIVRADVELAVAAGTPSQAGGPTTIAAAPEDERVPLSSIRRITAQRLTQSAAAPQFYLTSVVDVGALLTLRTDLNQTLGDHAPRITITDLLIRACAITLGAHPQVNASWGDDHLLRHGHVNIGCAVALDDGLIVPVIHDADRKSLSQIAAEAHDLAQRARAGKLTPDAFTGGTFTISNLGMYGIDHFTAVINPPEATILAVGAVQQEAVVRDGHIRTGVTMKLTLSVDHRVLDGATAAAFLRDIVGVLTHPLRILV